MGYELSPIILYTGVGCRVEDDDSAMLGCTVQDPILFKPLGNDVMMLMCRFSFCLASIFLIQLDDPVSAEWVALDGHFQSHPLQTVYIEPDTIHREGHGVLLSVLIDWKAMQGGRTPTRFYSTTLTKQVDCAEQRVRTLSSIDFSGHMGLGQIIGGGSHTGRDRWVAIESGTINDGLWEAVCGKE